VRPVSRQLDIALAMGTGLVQGTGGGIALLAGRLGLSASRGGAFTSSRSVLRNGWTHGLSRKILGDIWSG
jgi:hypothetical protein